jgi:hypothetical protein
MLGIDKTYPWFVPVGGYRLHIPSVVSRGETPDESFFWNSYLVEARTRASLRKYEVWDEPALYLRFAALPPPLDDEHWLAFASKYGPLRIEWHPYEIEEGMLRDDPDAVWDAAMEKRRPYLERGAPEIFTPVAETRREWWEQVVAMSSMVSKWRELVDATPLGQEFFLWSIAEMLNGRLLFLDNKGRMDPEGIVDTSFSLNPETNAPELALVPRSLLGAMWLQFASDVAAGGQLRACEVCANEFAVFPSDGRTMRRRTCSSGCRTKLSEEGKHRDD